MTRLREKLALLLQEAPHDAIAVEHEGVQRTWAWARDLDASLRAALSAAGVDRSTRVGVILENRPEHVGSVISLIAGGHTLVTLSPMQPAERLARDLRTSRPPVVVCSEATLKVNGLREAAAECGHLVVVDAEGKVRLEASPTGPACNEELATSPGVVIEMMTSGTTGPPKRIALRDQQLDRALKGAGHTPDKLLSSGVNIIAAPLVHIGGLWGMISTVHAGRKVVLMTKFAVEPWADLVERHRPRAASLVPAALRAVLEAEVPAEKLRSLAVVTSGTARCPAELADAFQDRYGVRVLTNYGATEYAGAVAMWTKQLHEEWWEQKKGSVGRPSKGVEIRIAGPDGEPLPAGSEGIVEIRSAQTSAGDATWLSSSDRGRLDDDGFLYITGRSDDAIVRGGFKVHPEVLKSRLEQHPAVLEAEVLPRDDERLGQVPYAAVQLRASVEERPTEEELRTWCRAELTPYEVPARVLVTDELPRTVSAKVSRVDLHKEFDRLLNLAPASASGTAGPPS